MASLRIYFENTVRFQVSHQGKRITFSLPISIEERQWDDSKRMVKNHSFSFDLNNDIQKYQAKVEKYLHEKRGSFSMDKAKREIAELLRPKEETRIEGVFQYLDRFISESQTIRAPLTIKKYVSLKKLLKKFQPDLDFDDFSKDFGERFLAWLLFEKKQLNNTAEKYISCLRTFLTWAEDKGVRVNKDYIKFKGKKHNIEPVYLTKEELLHLYNLPLTSVHEKVRDVFCFACWTGLRYSDVAKFSKANIKGDAIYVKMQKTSDDVRVPLNKYSKAILEKWDYKLPVISNVKTNSYLKEVCKIAEFDSQEKLIQFRGVERIETSLKKWEIISFHDARRTFIILLLIEGVPQRVVMEMSGHKSYASFEKYVKIADSVAQDAMKKVWG